MNGTVYTARHRTYYMTFPNTPNANP